MGAGFSFGASYRSEFTIDGDGKATEGHQLLAGGVDLGLAATVNSDDPAYFGGYMTDNFLAVHSALGLSRQQYVTLAANAISASFIDRDRKAALRAELDAEFGLNIAGQLFDAIEARLEQ